jgi:hypothetical protein
MRLTLRVPLRPIIVFGYDGRDAVKVALKGREYIGKVKVTRFDLRSLGRPFIVKQSLGLHFAQHA